MSIQVRIIAILLQCCLVYCVKTNDADTGHQSHKGTSPKAIAPLLKSQMHPSSAHSPACTNGAYEEGKAKHTMQLNNCLEISKDSAADCECMQIYGCFLVESKKNKIPGVDGTTQKQCHFREVFMKIMSDYALLQQAASKLKHCDLCGEPVLPEKVAVQLGHGMTLETPFVRYKPDCFEFSSFADGLSHVQVKKLECSSAHVFHLKSKLCPCITRDACFYQKWKSCASPAGHIAFALYNQQLTIGRNEGCWQHEKPNFYECKGFSMPDAREPDNGKYKDFYRLRGKMNKGKAQLDWEPKYSQLMKDEKYLDTRNNNPKWASGGTSIGARKVDQLLAKDYATAWHNANPEKKLPDDAAKALDEAKNARAKRVALAVKAHAKRMKERALAKSAAAAKLKPTDAKNEKHKYVGGVILPHTIKKKNAD